MSDEAVLATRHVAQVHLAAWPPDGVRELRGGSVVVVVVVVVVVAGDVTS